VASQTFLFFIILTSMLIWKSSMDPMQDLF
jgi:hypothetical protein